MNVPRNSGCLAVLIETSFLSLIGWGVIKPSSSMSGAVDDAFEGSGVVVSAVAVGLTEGTGGILFKSSAPLDLGFPFEAVEAMMMVEHGADCFGTSID